MQQKSLLSKRYYYLSKVDERDYSKIVFERKRKLDLYDKLISEKCSEETALEAIDVSRATYHRWKKCFKEDGLAGLEPLSRRPKKVRSKSWSSELIENVLQERKKHLVLGKQKITLLLKRKCKSVPSESTVGRILKHLVDRQRVHPASFYTGKYCPKPRKFNNHAKRIPPGLKARNPGELMQIDHMTVTINSGKKVKHFQAICPVTRYSVGKAYREASSFTATKFLAFLRQKLPFRLLSAQVDGGSEFMGEFEKSFKELDIPLYVLPPRSPKMNAFVERMNGTVKYEFYSLYDKKDNLEVINSAMHEYERFYNEVRPHAGLQSLSPLEYSRKIGGLY